MKRLFVFTLCGTLLLYACAPAAADPLDIPDGSLDTATSPLPTQQQSIATNPSPTAASELPLGAPAVLPLPEDAPVAFLETFTQYSTGFGVDIYATESVPAETFRHAVAVLAQYLDNDEDGSPDNARVVQALADHDASLVIFASETEMEDLDFFGQELPEEMVIQDLFAEEIVLNALERGEFDYSWEEMLHLITSGGYHYVYPEVWGETQGTAVAEAMDLARGGHFEQVPEAYPSEAWYSYDDETCEYECQISEYIYWSLTSLLGAQDLPSRLDEIEHEWRLNTAAKLQAGDPAIYALLTDPEYAWPTQLPDGDYQPGSP